MGLFQQTKDKIKDVKLIHATGGIIDRGNKAENRMLGNEETNLKTYTRSDYKKLDNKAKLELYQNMSKRHKTEN